MPFFHGYRRHGHEDAQDGQEKYFYRFLLGVRCEEFREREEIEKPKQ